MDNKKWAILIVTVIVGVLTTIFSAIFTNGFESVSSLYVVSGDNVYARGERTVEFTEYESGNICTFTVKSSGFDKSKTIDYTVKAEINAEYSATADGALLTLAAETDVTDRIVQSVNGNEIQIKLYTLTDFLKDVYGYSEVDVTNNIVPYTITISSGDKAIKLNFKANMKPQGITVEPSEIIF